MLNIQTVLYFSKYTSVCMRFSETMTATLLSPAIYNNNQTPLDGNKTWAMLSTWGNTNCMVKTVIDNTLHTKKKYFMISPCIMGMQLI